MFSSLILYSPNHMVWLFVPWPLWFFSPAVGGWGGGGSGEVFYMAFHNTLVEGGMEGSMQVHGARADSHVNGKP